MKYRFAAILCLWFLMVSTTVSADDDAFEHALVTDRPDAAESSETVGKLRFQFETSFAWSQDEDAGVTTRTYSFPTLLRFGILEPLELRVEGEMLAIQTATGSSTQTGFTDLAVGAKVHLQDNDGLAPSLGLLAHANLPTGKDAFSANAVEPIFKVLMDWELPADFTLGANGGFDIPVRDAANDKFARLLYAIAVGHPLPPSSLVWRAFIEFAGAIPTTSGKAAEHQFDTGLAWCITPDTQVDAVVQIGLSDAAADIAAGIGLSMRFF